MKKVFKAFEALLLSVFIAISSFSFPVYAETEEEAADEFAGTRKIVYSADKSDLDNFIDGGRSALDILIRSSAPSWIYYDMSSKDRTVYLTLSFDFSSFEDYSEKLQFLLTYYPPAMYSNSGGLTLIEGFSSSDMINFIQSVLASLEMLREQELKEVLKADSSSIIINSVNYTSNGDRIVIRPDGTPVVKFDYLEISTQMKKDGSCLRTINACIDSTLAEPDDLEKAVKCFKKVGKPTQTEDPDTTVTKLSVDFEATGQSELMNKTMSCLNAAVSISEKQAYVDDKTVGVTRMEFFDLEELMRDENSNFNYRYSFPKYYKNVVPDDSTTIEDGTIHSSDSSYISYYYERGFTFNSVSIETDFSSLFGKISRTITMKSPSDLAVHYHSTIKKQLQSRMIRGTVFNIYDEGGSRYYELSYSSWFAGDIEKFTAAVINQKYSFAVDEGLLPYGKVEIQDGFLLNEIISGMAPVENVSAKYILPAISNISSGAGEALVTEKTAVFSEKYLGTIHFEYFRLSLSRLLIELLLLLVVIIGVYIAVRKFRKKLRNKKEKNSGFYYESNENQNLYHEGTQNDNTYYGYSENTQEYICPNCGEFVDPSQNFCGKCGIRFYSADHNGDTYDYDHMNS